MPPIEVPIPLTALVPGTHSFGPASVSDDVRQATISVDRTVSRPNADGLNAQPASTRVELTVLQSDDGGASWQLRASAGLIGGLYPANQAGDPYLISDVQVELSPGAARRVRADVVVTGAARVAIAGTLAIV